MRALSTSDHYAVLADHDYVYLRDAEGRDVLLGWMYGNAQAAYIHPRETFAVVVGCGLWVIRLPLDGRFEPDAAPSVSTAMTLRGEATVFVHVPLVRLMEDPDDIMWLETVYDTGETSDSVRVVADLTSDYAGVYDVDVATLHIEKRL